MKFGQISEMDQAGGFFNPRSLTCHCLVPRLVSDLVPYICQTFILMHSPKTYSHTFIWARCSFLRCCSLLFFPSFFRRGEQFHSKYNSMQPECFHNNSAQNSRYQKKSTFPALFHFPIGKCNLALKTVLGISNKTPQWNMIWLYLLYSSLQIVAVQCCRTRLSEPNCSEQCYQWGFIYGYCKT